MGYTGTFTFGLHLSLISVLGLIPDGRLAFTETSGHIERLP
jgi:hypothetical protein